MEIIWLMTSVFRRTRVILTLRKAFRAYPDSFENAKYPSSIHVENVVVEPATPAAQHRSDRNCIIKLACSEECVYRRVSAMMRSIQYGPANAHIEMISFFRSDTNPMIRQPIPCAHATGKTARPWSAISRLTHLSLFE